MGGFENWKWSGCSDNVEFGQKVAKQFMDGRETGRDSTAIINLQNNRAGRVVGILFRLYWRYSARKVKLI